MVGRVTSSSVEVARRIERACRGDLDERRLRVAVLEELRSFVSFDAYAWLLTDPVTCVGWSPVAELPTLADLPDVIAAKYLSDLDRWSDQPAGGVSTWADAARPFDSNSSPFVALLRSRYAISDVLSVVLRDKAGCWGFLDLWRRNGVFDRAERGTIADAAAVVTAAVRRSLLPTFATPTTAATDGPVVLMLGDDLRPFAQTASTGKYLEALLPPAPGATVVPAAALNVAAQLRAVEAGVDDRAPEARIHVPERSWMTIRAGRIGAPGAGAPAITVSIEPTRPTERSALYACVAGLSRRETDVLVSITAGLDTRHTAQRLGITENTVQDHIKAVFAKTATDSRRQLIARATGTTT